MNQSIQEAHLPATRGDAPDAEIIESVITKGDLAKLSAHERTRLYVAVCKSCGLNPLTKPFEYITLNGKLVLYALRSCTDQLRTIHGVSVEELAETTRDGVYIVTAKVRNKDGRTDMAKGAVTIANLKGDALANAIMKAECVPLESEILTRDGFKRFDQLTIGQEVLAYDCGSDASVWTPLLNVTTYDAAPLIRMQSTKGQFSVVCTPDHSWAIRGSGYVPRGSGVRKLRGPYSNRKPLRRLVKSIDINKNHRIILAAQERDTEDTILEPVEAAILGWAVTDGTIQRRGSFVRVGICQSKEENFETIRELVGGVKEIVSPGRTRTFPSSGRTYETKPQHWWYLPSQVSRDLLKKAGYQNRTDLPRIVTRLNHPARAAMLQAMMLAEGDKRHIFANGDASIMEAFEIICALEGSATGSLTAKDTIWTKRLKLTRQVAGSFLSIVQAGVGPVWCPTTAFGTWVMRQNGRVMITGNTKSKRRATLSICGLGFLDESELETIPARAREQPQTNGNPRPVQQEAPRALEAPAQEPALAPESPAPSTPRRFPMDPPHDPVTGEIQESAYISQDDLAKLIGFADNVGADKIKLCKFLRIQSLASLPASRLEEAKTALDNYRAKKMDARTAR